MKIALLGASGKMGCCLVEELLGRQHLVTGLCRNPTAIANHENLTATGCDATDSDRLGEVLSGHDAIVVSIRFLGLDATALITGIRRSAVNRVVMVGHSGTLLVNTDLQLVDTDQMTTYFKPEALDAREAYKLLRRCDDLAWTYATPPALLTLGNRTGEFRLGDDYLIRDRLGESRISMQDFAIAIVDELEEPHHIKRRFTAAY